MPYFAWDEKYDVGVKAFNTQHHKLVDLLNSLFDAMKAGKGKQVLSSTLDELIEYTKYHFGAEEELMAKERYPEILRHKQEHIQLTSKVLKLQEDLGKGNSAITVELSNFLKDWLVNHIMGTDKKYAKFFNDKGIT